jgi:glycogen debranching enzyme
VWAHPVRIIKNLGVAFKVGDGGFEWSHLLVPQLQVRPSSFTREYHIRGTFVRETVFGDYDHPSGSIQFSVESKKPVSVLLTGQIDLRLMWPLSDKATGPMEYCWDKNLQAVLVFAPTSNAYSVIGGSLLPKDQRVGQFAAFTMDGDRLGGVPTTESMVSFALRYDLSTNKKAFTITFAGSHQHEDEAIRAYRAMINRPSSSLQKQDKHFRDLLRRSTQIISPDDRFNEGYRWALTSTDRFFADTAGVGASFMAGFGTTERGWNGDKQVSGRPGYAWYFGRDSVWTSFAALGYGDMAKVRSVLEFLGRHQDITGKILHEITTSGYVHYDAADSTPLYLILMGRYLKSSGDRSFIKREFPRIKKAIEFCSSTDADHDHLIENTNVGHGWVEGGKLFPAHVEHYLASCWMEALKESSYVAHALNKPSFASRWGKESTIVRNIIDRDFWNEPTQFYNFGKRANGSFDTEKTVLPAVGISFGLADSKKAGVCLDELASAKFSADWGTRIVGSDSALFNPTGYHYGSVWPLFTGWTSLAEFKMRRPVQGYQHAMSNLQLFDLFSAGTIQEVFNGETLEPTGVCSHQAWSESMVLQPLLEGMLGIECDALHNTLRLRPYFPPHWNKATARNIYVGPLTIQLTMSRERDKTSYRFLLHGKGGLSIEFQPYLSLGSIISKVRVGTTRVKAEPTVAEYRDCPIISFKLRSKRPVTVFILHKGGIGLVPPIAKLVPGQQSQGLRVIREWWNSSKYFVMLEGRAGADYSLQFVDHDRLGTSVEGATITERVNEMLTVRVSFEPQVERQQFDRKVISLSTL